MSLIRRFHSITKGTPPAECALLHTYTTQRKRRERERYGVDLEEDTSRDKVVVNKVDKVVGVLDVGDDLVRERLRAVQTGPVSVNALSTKHLYSKTKQAIRESVLCVKLFSNC